MKNNKSSCAFLPWMAKLERHLAELDKILLLRPGKITLQSSTKDVLDKEYRED